MLQPPTALNDEIDNYLARPPRRLEFPASIETLFVTERTRRRSEAFYNDVVGGMILGNVMGFVLTFCGLLTPFEMTSSFVIAHGFIQAPMLLTLSLMRRVPKLYERVDLIAAALFLLNIAGLIAISRCWHGEIGLYQAFAMMTLPVKFNLLETVSFRDAVRMAGVYLPSLIWNAFTHSGFSQSASWFLGCLYGVLTGISLAANYRMEASERLNFLSVLRERLRGEEIIDANRQLDVLARTDALTGLANRRDFDQRFVAEAARMRAQAEPLTLIVLDIDHFKLYNDRLGHPQGDKCIRVVARAIMESIGPAPAFAGRIGGEEFAAVLPSVSIETAAATAQKIRSAVEAMQLPHPALGERRVVSVSLGVACLNPARPESPEALMARADAALYRAKRAGHDRAEVDLRVVGA